jgi:hypothetical protein
MRENAFLLVLAVAGSALLWWPVTIEPNLNLPLWLPLAFIAILTGVVAALSGGRWLRFVVASAVGTFVGLCSGYEIWPPADPIARPYVPYVIAMATLAAVLVSLVASLVGRRVLVLNQNRRRAVWLGLLCCVGCGPVGLALTPPLVAHRVGRNDRLAAERFESLQNAIERTLAEAGDSGRICDGQALKRHYSGPPFSEKDWHRIVGNYVKEDGYSFGVYCHEKGGYTIHAIPWVGKGQGTRQFCSDESGKIGCAMEWNRSRNACVPCPK